MWLIDHVHKLKPDEQITMTHTELVVYSFINLHGAGPLINFGVMIVYKITIIVHRT